MPEIETTTRKGGKERQRKEEQRYAGRQRGRDWKGLLITQRFCQLDPYGGGIFIYDFSLISPCMLWNVIPIFLTYSIVNGGGRQIEKRLTRHYISNRAEQEGRPHCAQRCLVCWVLSLCSAHETKLFSGRKKRVFLGLWLCLIIQFIHCFQSTLLCLEPTSFGSTKIPLIIQIEQRNFYFVVTLERNIIH